MSRFFALGYRHVRRFKKSSFSWFRSKKPETVSYLFLQGTWIRFRLINSNAQADTLPLLVLFYGMLAKDSFHHSAKQRVPTIKVFSVQLLKSCRLTALARITQLTLFLTRPGFIFEDKTVRCQTKRVEENEYRESVFWKERMNDQQQVAIPALPG